MATATAPLSNTVRRRFGRDAAWRDTVWGELLAEFLGTFVLVTLGDAAVAMAVAALPESARAASTFVAADWLIIAWGWGLGVMFGVYIAGGISKAHLNPALTLTFALRRGFPWRKVPAYMLVQVLGGFAAGALVYANYKGAIGAFEHTGHIVRGQPTSVKSFSIFATFPAKYYSSWVGPFVDQVIGTAFLAGLVYALIDEFNTPVKSNLAGLLIGFVVVAIGLSFGANAGYAINPARDLGPRLFAWIAGWSKLAVPGNYGNVNGYMWVPIIGPFVGAVIGAGIYDFFIRTQLVATGAKPDPEVAEGGRAVADQSSAASHT